MPRKPNRTYIPFCGPTKPYRSAFEPTFSEVSHPSKAFPGSRTTAPAAPPLTTRMAKIHIATTVTPCRAITRDIAIRRRAWVTISVARIMSSLSGNFTIFSSVSISVTPEWNRKGSTTPSFRPAAQWVVCCCNRWRKIVFPAISIHCMGASPGITGRRRYCRNYN